MDSCKTLNLAIVRFCDDTTGTIKGRLTVTYISTHPIRQECPTIGVNIWCRAVNQILRAIFTILIKKKNSQEINIGEVMIDGNSFCVAESRIGIAGSTGGLWQV